MPRGLHSRPSTTSRAAQTVALTGAATSGLLVVASPAQAADQAAWDQVVDCESGGRNVNNSSGPGGTPASTASGYFQIIDGTWRAYGGLEFGPRAIDATYDEQLIVAERILAGQGPGAWGVCGAALQGQPFTDRDAPPKPAPAPPPPPAPPVEPEPAPPVEPEIEEIPAQQSLTIQVERGDWLSTIARDRIEGLCEPGDDITTCWQPLYDQNRDVIGPNPDRIFPGMTLTYAGNLVLPSGPPVEVPQEAPEAEPAPPVAEEPPAAASRVAGAVAHPTGGTSVTSEFGGARNHKGLDFDGEIGDPVYAATDGIVTAVEIGGYNGGWGGRIELTAADGTITAYNHLSASVVATGDVVVAGDQIGKIGNTGHVIAGRGGDGSHLDFQVIVGPGPINPRPWLAERGVVL